MPLTVEEQASFDRLIFLTDKYGKMSLRGLMEALHTAEAEIARMVADHDANCDECLSSETQLKNENATLWLEVRRLREANEALFVAVGDDGYAEDRSEFWAAVARCCALHIAHDIAEGTK